MDLVNTHFVSEMVKRPRVPICLCVFQEDNRQNLKEHETKQ